MSPISISESTITYRPAESGDVYGFERVTVVVSLEGDGETARGEDVTYDGDANVAFANADASLFYPDSPNDVTPSGYNDPNPSRGLPSSPLEAPAEP
ncbi:MAG: hypothetical protein RI560_01085 [Natronomonas sp.]|uniref:hypothetical protein n=1 Tax=Natronomonas sp. TaxID=2184060 RepID=UPI0028700B62|nr:hypothetical protein [Natronomonas sp.]MDR9380255.1 hypothetical protein [Natronomonas sp.]MDR9430697.1 hypothetical protein [Natronomonas sp.]